MPPLSWGSDSLALDSLARLQLATAAATWCNAYDSGFEDLFLAKRNVSDWADVMQRSRSAGAKHFTFTTSGSTGQRKHLRHTETMLWQEAHAWARVLGESAQGTPKRVVVLAPTHHIYGFIWGVLLPMVLDVSVVDAELTALPTLQTGDLLVAVPDQWLWLATSTTSVWRWPPGVQGISSTAPLAAATHQALTTPESPGSAAALSRLLQIYGSTETAGVAWRDSPSGDYQLAPGRIRGEADQIELVMPDGQHAVLALQDELRWRDATRFELLRRADASVQVGGHNVSPAWVAEQLCSHPVVHAASVRLDPRATPPRLKAFVVLTQTDDLAARQSFEEWMAETLPWYAMPNAVCYGSELPRNALGKPSDWAPD
jgi:4-coumarate--CoA ligase (photoactive yellow protein activation family)